MFIMQALELAERVDDPLLGDGGGDACEHEKTGLKDVMGFDDGEAVSSCAGCASDLG